MTKLGRIPVVTERTITEPGWYWFEPTYERAGGRAEFVRVDQDIIDDKQQLDCLRYRGKYAGPIEPPEMYWPMSNIMPPGVWKRLTKSEDALNKLQDSVWSSLDKYSKALGWGLSGIQPECWMLLDAAVDELKKRRAVETQVIRIIERLKCRCLTLDCNKHGSYIPGDYDYASAIINQQSLFPKKAN
jgi:hypothetical protein